MTYEEFKAKHSVFDRLRTYSSKKKNDKFYFWDEDSKTEKIGYYIKDRLDISPNHIEYETSDGSWMYWSNNRIMDIEQIHIFKVVELNTKQCSCGAKHTSNPDHHLMYCDLNKE